MPNVGTRGNCFKIDKRKEIVKITCLHCVRPAVKPVEFKQNLRDSLFTFFYDEAPLSNLFSFVRSLVYHNYSCTYLKNKVFSLSKQEGQKRDLEGTEKLFNTGQNCVLMAYITL